ncbi:hypothetical protein ACLOJK_003420 [Asimina triloba]
MQGKSYMQRRQASEQPQHHCVPFSNPNTAANCKLKSKLLNLTSKLYCSTWYHSTLQRSALAAKPNLTVFQTATPSTQTHLIAELSHKPLVTGHRFNFLLPDITDPPKCHEQPQRNRQFPSLVFSRTASPSNAPMERDSSSDEEDERENLVDANQAAKLRRSFEIDEFRSRIGRGFSFKLNKRYLFGIFLALFLIFVLFSLDVGHLFRSSSGIRIDTKRIGCENPNFAPCIC